MSDGGHPIAEDTGGMWYRETIMGGVRVLASVEQGAAVGAIRSAIIGAACAAVGAY